MYLNEASLLNQYAQKRCTWAKLPFYKNRLTPVLSDMPQLLKTDIQQNFPQGFLLPGTSLNKALDACELEYTSGSTSERMPVLFLKGWWAWQELQVLNLNKQIREVLKNNKRRITIVPPICNGLVCFSNYMPKTTRIVGSTLFINQARIPFLLEKAELQRMVTEAKDWNRS